jgi:hypothetical protein
VASSEATMTRDEQEREDREDRRLSWSKVILIFMIAFGSIGMLWVNYKLDQTYQLLKEVREHQRNNK